MESVGASVIVESDGYLVEVDELEVSESVGLVDSDVSSGVSGSRVICVASPRTLESEYGTSVRMEDCTISVSVKDSRELGSMNPSGASFSITKIRAELVLKLI